MASCIHPSGLLGLPDELVLLISDYLGPSECTVLTRVSKPLRILLAMNGAALSFEICVSHYRDCRRRIDNLVDIASHCARTGFGLRLKISYNPSGRNSAHPAIDIPGHSSQLGKFLMGISPALCSVLPHTVHLDILLHSDWSKAFNETLRSSSAPRLRSFVYSRLLGDKEISIPHDIFQGEAPKLRHVAIRLVPVPVCSAFRLVSSAMIIDQSSLPRLAIITAFPRLRNLALGCHDEPGQLHDLTGLDLRSIWFQDPSSSDLYIERYAFLDDLAVVHTRRPFPSPGFMERLWTGDANPVRVRFVKRDSDMLFFVNSPSTRLRRLVTIPWWTGARPLPFKGMKQASTRVVYLRMDNMFIPGLLLCTTEFLALTELQIDFSAAPNPANFMIWPPNYISSLAGRSFMAGDKSILPTGQDRPFDITETPKYLLRFPLLQSLVLYALRSNTASISLNGLEVVFLSHALGFPAGERRSKVSLSLVGISLLGPDDCGLLPWAFRKIDRIPFQGEGSFSDFCGGPWETWEQENVYF